VSIAGLLICGRKYAIARAGAPSANPADVQFASQEWDKRLGALALLLRRLCTPQPLVTTSAKSTRTDGTTQSAWWVTRMHQLRAQKSSSRRIMLGTLHSGTIRDAFRIWDGNWFLFPQQYAPVLIFLFNSQFSFCLIMHVLVAFCCDSALSHVQIELFVAIRHQLPLLERFVRLPVCEYLPPSDMSPRVSVHTHLGRVLWSEIHAMCDPTVLASLQRGWSATTGNSQSLVDNSKLPMSAVIYLRVLALLTIKFLGSPSDDPTKRNRSLLPASVAPLSLSVSPVASMMLALVLTNQSALLFELALAWIRVERHRLGLQQRPQHARGVPRNQQPFRPLPIPMWSLLMTFFSSNKEMAQATTICRHLEWRLATHPSIGYSSQASPSSPTSAVAFSQGQTSQTVAPKTAPYSSTTTPQFAESSSPAYWWRSPAMDTVTHYLSMWLRCHHPVAFKTSWARFQELHWLQTIHALPSQHRLLQALQTVCGRMDSSLKIGSSAEPTLSEQVAVICNTGGARLGEPGAHGSVAQSPVISAAKTNPEAPWRDIRKQVAEALAHHNVSSAIQVLESKSLMHATTPRELADAEFCWNLVTNFVVAQGHHDEAVLLLRRRLIPIAKVRIYLVGSSQVGQCSGDIPQV
jgi:hypothetical protein